MSLPQDMDGQGMCSSQMGKNLRRTSRQRFRSTGRFPEKYKSTVAQEISASHVQTDRSNKRRRTSFSADFEEEGQNARGDSDAQRHRPRLQTAERMARRRSTSSSAFPRFHSPSSRCTSRSAVITSEPSFPILLQCIDLIRQTEIHLENLDERTCSRLLGRR